MGSEGLADNHQFVAQLSAGDPAAMSALHERFSERIFFLGLKQLGSRADAEDVRNETLVRVTQAIRAGRLEAPDALPSFVAATARNVIFEFLRKGRRVAPLEDHDVAVPAVEPAVDHTERRAMQIVLQRLKPRERDFIRLYYFEEWNKAQISKRLGIPEERLRLLKSRTLKAFREIYENLVK